MHCVVAVCQVERTLHQRLLAVEAAFDVHAWYCYIACSIRRQEGSCETPKIHWGTQVLQLLERDSKRSISQMFVPACQSGSITQ